MGFSLGIFRPIHCEEAALNVENCLLQGSLWNNETVAKLYIKSKTLALKGKENTFLPPTGPAKPFLPSKQTLQSTVGNSRVDTDPVCSEGAGL